LICQYINSLLTPSEGNKFWKEEIKERLQSKYTIGLSAHELDQSLDLRDAIDMKSLFHFFLPAAGLKLSKASKVHIKSDVDNFMFVEDDIKSIEAKTQHVSFVYFSDGMTLKQRAVDMLRETVTDYRQFKTSKRRLEIIRQLEAATEAFSHAHAVSPRCPLVYTEWGNAHMILSKVFDNETERDRVMDVSEDMYHHALRIWKALPLPLQSLVKLYTMKVHIAKEAGFAAEEIEQLEKKLDEFKKELEASGTMMKAVTACSWNKKGEKAH